MVNTGKVMSTAISLPVAAAVASSIKSFANLEQAIGGVETLFKSSAGAVIKNSESAYRRAGVSGTEYMEQVTSFSATLLQGLGGDTEKAAKIADIAMVDMSDNANKFGTNIGSVQDAYQGFAKQNYTMLDNLKLGYGGTAGEMARLINDSGVLGDTMVATADNVNDIDFHTMIEAIHKVQDEMGITGTTSKEAEETVSGSFGMMKASLQDLSAGFGQENANMESLMANFKSSVEAFVGNIKRVLGNMWDNLPLAEWQKWVGVVIVAAGPMLLVFGTIITKVGAVALAVGKAGSVMGGLASLFPGLTAGLGLVKSGFALLMGPVGLVIGIITALIGVFVYLYKTNEDFRNKVNEVWGQIKEFINSAVQEISSFVQEIFGSLVSWWSENNELIKQTAETVWNGILAIVSTVMSVLSPLLTTAWEAIKTVVTLVWENIKTVISTALDVILNVIKAVMLLINGDWTAAWELIKESLSLIWEAIKVLIENYLLIIQQVLTVAWEAIKLAMELAWEGIKLVIQTAIDLIVVVISTAWEVIKLATSLAWEGIKLAISLVWEGIKVIVQTAINIVKAIVTTGWNVIKTVTSTVFNAIKSVVTTVWNGIKAVIQTVVNVINSVVTAAWNAIKSVTSSVFNAVRGVASSVWNGIKSTIQSVVNSIKSVVTSVWNGIKSTTSSVFNSIKSVATSTWNGVKNAMITPIEAAKSKISGIVNAIKGFFSGMRLRIPKISMPPLPHFSLSGSFSLKPPSVPKLSVSWYKDGGIMQDPTMFGMNGNSMMVGGEAGPEAILPLNPKTLGGIGLGIAKEMEHGQDAVVSKLDQLIRIIESQQTQINNLKVVMDSGALVGSISSQMNRALGQAERYDRRGR
ncbi:MULTISPECIES: hypothetical protein [Vagococcus]|uniref:hypothetical protein n=1 Tax=Vagococcus TaxID=2737 RepID=UPI0011C47EA6|nr:MULTISPECIES: hypothetical protein [Vagococcus]